VPNSSSVVKTYFNQRQEPMNERPRILIADPDTRLLETYERYFNQDDWSLSTAVNGLDCMAKLFALEPDVLVLEPEMPWGSGSGVLARMREDPRVPSVSVIVLTMGRDKAELSRVSNFALEEILIKPVSVEILGSRIRAVVGKMAEEVL